MSKSNDTGAVLLLWCVDVAKMKEKEELAPEAA